MGQIRRDLPNDEYQAAVGSNNASASNVFATIADLASAGIPTGIGVGTDAYASTIPGVTSYNDGDTYIIKFTNGNTADSTIDINGLGVKTLTKQVGVQVTGGDILAGQEIIIIYDGTNFQCIGLSTNQLFAFVTNAEAITITKGQPVYAFGGTGNRMSVKLASNTSDATSAQTVGLVYSSSIAANQTGFIIIQGVISGVNTGGFTAGNQLYLGALAGTLTNVKPYAPNHLVYIGIVERANAGNGLIYVRTQNGYELDELHDVDLITTPPTDGQVLTYDSVTGLWRNESLPADVNIYNSNGTLAGNRTVTMAGNTLNFTGGNVGIGTNTPTEKLDVNGKTKTTTFQMTTSPVVGYVLTSDASGNGTWTAPTSSSGRFGIADSNGVYTYYTTLSLAMTAATAGQTIEMFADVTETGAVTITLKNGVNINGNGHTYNYTNATGNCFIDNGVAVTCNIQNLNIVRTGHTADNILRITGTNSFIDCTGSFLKCTSASSNAFVVVCGGSISNVNVLATGTNLQGIQVNSFGAKGVIRNSYSETTGSGTAILGDLTQYAAEHGIFNCYGKSVSGTGLACVKVVNSIGWSTSGSGIGGGNIYSSTGVSTSSYGITAAAIYSSTAISTSGIAIGGVAYNSTGISASGSARGGGASHNCNFTTAGAPVYPTFGINPGSIYNCFLESTWNNSAGHGLTFASNYAAAAIDVVNSTIRVVNASANCIVSFNPVGTPINYSNNVFKGATTPIGPNITQNVVNTQDNQGNILL